MIIENLNNTTDKMFFISNIFKMFCQLLCEFEKIENQREQIFAFLLQLLSYIEEFKQQVDEKFLKQVSKFLFKCCENIFIEKKEILVQKLEQIKF